MRFSIYMKIIALQAFPIKLISLDKIPGLNISQWLSPDSVCISSGICPRFQYPWSIIHQNARQCSHSARPVTQNLKVVTFRRQSSYRFWRQFWWWWLEENGLGTSQAETSIVFWINNTHDFEKWTQILSGSSFWVVVFTTLSRLRISSTCWLLISRNGVWVPGEYLDLRRFLEKVGDYY